MQREMKKKVRNLNHQLMRNDMSEVFLLEQLSCFSSAKRTNRNICLKKLASHPNTWLSKFETS